MSEPKYTTVEEDLGWIKGAMSEHLLRMDRFGVRQEKIEAKLIEVLSTMHSITSRDALLSALIGACAGAITGTMASMVLCAYLVPVLMQ